METNQIPDFGEPWREQTVSFMPGTIEIGSNVIALFKLPMPVKELAGVVEHLERSYGAELRMIEKPQGWLQFFKP